MMTTFVLLSGAYAADKLLNELSHLYQYKHLMNILYKRCIYMAFSVKTNESCI